MKRAHATRVAAVLGALLVAFVVLPLTRAFAAADTKTSSTSHTPGASAEVDTSLRFGCSNGGWVEVRLRTVPASGTSQNVTEVVQVGYTTTGKGPDPSYPSGGPLQVSIDNQVTLVRLAGAPPAGASVFVKRLTTGSVIVLPIPSTCSDAWPTNFKTAPVVASMALPVCLNATTASVSVTVDNPNKRRVVGGPRDVDYTLLAVDPAGLVLNDPGALLAFTSAGPKATTVAVPGNGHAFAVRVIGMDGSVEVLAGSAPDCTPTVTPPSPSSSTPAVPSTSASHTPPVTPPTSGETTAQTTPTAGPTSETPVVVPSAESSAPTSSVVTATPSRTSARPTPEVSHTPSATATPTPKPSKTRTLPLLANAPSTHSAFKLQRSAALVVLADAAAIGALVIGTTQFARRR